MEDDHVAAVVGSVQDDMEGRMMREAYQGLQFDELWLGRALERLMEVHKPSPNDFAAWANRRGAFPDTGLLRPGIEAWDKGDWVKCLHVLVPQIEAGLRTILRGLGGAVVKPHPQGGGREVLLSMNEVLAEERMKEAFGDDLVHYFRAAYTDPRSLNLRNQLAHGLIHLGTARAAICDLLIHSILVLGCWRDIAESRAARANTENDPPAAEE